MPTTKSLLTEAFKNLRRQGFIARQSFLCCRGCAGAALDIPENHGKPVVYYTRQDAEDLAENGRVYLAYGYIGREVEDGYEKVGQEIVLILRGYGLEVEWDGSPETRILVTGVTPPPPPPPPATYLDLVGELYTDTAR